MSSPTTPPLFQSLLSPHFSLYSKPSSSSSSSFSYSYGTAGFRMSASLLPCALFRVGLLAPLLSRSLSGKAVGVMITASHNPVEDNGVKLINWDGSMIDAAWEVRCTQLANANSIEEASSLLQKFWTECSPLPNPHPSDSSPVGLVFVGRDTRPSSEELQSAVLQGIKITGGKSMVYGLVSTPQLHFLVRYHNQRAASWVDPHHPLEAPLPSANDYIDHVSTAYRQFFHSESEIRSIPSSSSSSPSSSSVPFDLTLAVDCACGVGAIPLKQLIEKIEHHSLLNPPSSILVCNEPVLTATSAHTSSSSSPPPLSPHLNHLCGSEYVQKDLKVPLGLESAFAIANTQQKQGIGGSGGSNVVFASIDGDADRLVFFTAKSPNSSPSVLFDGDKIAALILTFVLKQLSSILPVVAAKTSQLISSVPSSSSSSAPSYSLPVPIRVGVIQTAYANGASMEYFREMGQSYNSDMLVIESKLVPTGVKHLHHAALQYHVGIYFEANGHGTVLVDESLVHTLKQMDLSSSATAQEALRRFLALQKLANQAVGDALCDMLLVQAILRIEDIRPPQWEALYREFPSRQCKVAVPDRFLLKPQWDETRLTSPASLQKEIDRVVSQFPSSRAFVRPSGTEDVVRVFCEAPNMNQVQEMEKQIVELIKKEFPPK